MEITIFGRRYFLNKYVLCGIVLVLVIGTGLLGYFLRQVYHPLSQPVIEKNTADTINLEPEEQSDEPPVQEDIPEIKVYVVGCVNSPGVVTLKKGQLIDDAIKAAGGATKDADLENINLAYKLDDNSMLRIKPKNTAQQSKPVSSGSGTSGVKASESGHKPARPFRATPRRRLATR